MGGGNATFDPPPKPPLVRLKSSMYIDLLVKTKLLIIQQSVLHVHHIFCKKWALLAEFIMYQVLMGPLPTSSSNALS